MTDDREPGWLDTITTRVVPSPVGQRDPSSSGALRPAAVLVLLMDGDNGPDILLTERAAALTNYPGLLVFPGGSTEPGDDGPAATALREAAEEIGINSTQVHIIGSLPPLALPATRFLVTPVVGWCTRGQLTDSLCPEEVTVAVRVPLDEFANLSGRVQRSPEASTSAVRFTVDGTAVGPMTSIVIDALLDKGGVPSDELRSCPQLGTRSQRQPTAQPSAADGAAAMLTDRSDLGSESAQDQCHVVPIAAGLMDDVWKRSGRRPEDADIEQRQQGGRHRCCTHTSGAH